MSTSTMLGQKKFTTEEAAEILGVAPNTLCHWRLTGRYDLPYIKIGRCVRYLESDLEEFMKRRRSGVDADE